MNSSRTGLTNILTRDILPSKIRNVINIKHISSGEKYLHGLKPYNVSEKGKDIRKSIRKFTRPDKGTKAPDTRATPGKSSSEKKMIQIFLHPQVIKNLQIKKKIRKRLLKGKISEIG